MQEFNFNQYITQLLKADNRLVDEENDIQINVLRDLVNNLDSQLIELLISDEKVREKFFIKVKEVYVFKQNNFIFYLDSKELDGSYTQYANRIGLASGGKFLTDSTDYVLDFPYKDCVLEGGQSTEEGNDVYFEFDAETNDYVEKTAKRKEIFYNNIIAKDEIDRLLEPKAFQKVVRYDANGETIPTSFTRDAELNRQRGLLEDTITDNLIIKGNNLLSLHSLEKEFNGKVKLIYIDPPYNTGDDEFKYNDNFNHSTWLTFMYNRLVNARNLLKEDGVFTIQISEIEYSYLQLILNSIFGNENFVSSICVKMAHLSGTKMAHKGKKIPKLKEFILIYSKNKEQFSINPYYVPVEWDEAFSRYKSFIIRDDKDPDNHKLWQVAPLGMVLKENNLKYDNSKETVDFLIKNASNIFRTAINRSFDYTPYKRDEFNLINRGNNKIYIYKGEDVNFASYKINSIEGKLTPTSVIGDIWTDIGINNLSNEGGVSLRFGKKPEKLLERIISLFSQENDLVLDYHIGSGTTAAVAHKMNRQYIGIEQMDYIEFITIERMKKVLLGDSTGASKTNNWQGGGSFVYAELAKNNETAKERIEACNSLEELVQFFEELNTRYFLDYNVRIKDFKENIVKEVAFINLSLARQKELFKRMLDNNQLYVNISEVEDARYNLSEDAIRLTKDFYQIKN